jgi:hypothetical protein
MVSPYDISGVAVGDEERWENRRNAQRILENRQRILDALNQILGIQQERQVSDEDIEFIARVRLSTLESHQKEQIISDLMEKYKPRDQPLGEVFDMGVVTNLTSDIYASAISELGYEDIDSVPTSIKDRIVRLIEDYLFVAGGDPEALTDTRKKLSTMADATGVSSAVGKAIEDTERIVYRFPQHPTRARRFSRLLIEMKDAGYISDKEYRVITDPEKAAEEDSEFLTSVSNFIDTLYGHINQITDEASDKSGNWIEAIESSLEDETDDVIIDRGGTLYPTLGDAAEDKRRQERITEQDRQLREDAWRNPIEAFQRSMEQTRPYTPLSPEDPPVLGQEEGIYKSDLTKDIKSIYNEFERGLLKYIDSLKEQGVGPEEQQGVLDYIQELASQASAIIRQQLEQKEIDDSLKEEEQNFKSKYNTKGNRETSIFDDLMSLGVVSPGSNPSWIKYINDTVIPSIDLPIRKLISDGLVNRRDSLLNILPKLVNSFGTEYDFLTSPEYFQLRHDLEGEGLPPTFTMPQDVGPLPSFLGAANIIEPEPIPSEEEITVDLANMFNLSQDEEFLDFLVRNIDEIQKGFGQDLILMRGIPSDREKQIYEQILVPQARSRRMEKIAGLLPDISQIPLGDFAGQLSPIVEEGSPLNPRGIGIEYPIDYGELGRQARRKAQVEPPSFTEYFKGPVFERYAEEFRTSPIEQFRREKAAELEEERADIERQAESERMAAEKQSEQESQRRRLLRSGRTVISR